MANTAYLTSTNGTVGSGQNFGIMVHEPADQSKLQPLMIHLHGAGEYGDGTLGTIAKLEVAGVGPFAISKTTPWPQFDNPIDGELFQSFWVGPQLYRADPSTTPLWNNSYILECLRWAKVHLPIDPTRIYLNGLSLGGGGTILALTNAIINRQLAAAWAICPGYGNSSSVNHTYIAQSGIPLTVCHSANDGTAPVSNSQQIINRINAQRPLFPPRYLEWTEGGHIMWNARVYLTTPLSFPMTNGFNSIAEPGIFRECLMHRWRGGVDPRYI